MSTNEGMYIEGCHATIFILETGSLTSCPGWSQRCLKTYWERCCRCRCGLANSHLAVVADPTHPLLSTHQIQVGEWSPIRQLVFRTPRPARRRWGRGRGQRSRPVVQPPPPLVDIHFNYSQLRKLVAALDSAGLTPPEQAPPTHSRKWDELASQLHALLDNPPWSAEENTIVDVHWLLGEGPVPSPSTAASLSGALLRLRMWHNLNLQIVVCDTTSDSDSSEEWFDVVDARVCTADTWTDGLADIWRGSLHFTERRTAVKQACRETVVFSGFSLSLHTPSDEVTKTAPPLADEVTETAPPLAGDVTKTAPPLAGDVTKTAPPPADDVTKTAPPPDDDVTKTAPPPADDVTKTAPPLADDVIIDVITSSTTLLRNVGLPAESATPTHLEVVQILDTSTLPFFWLSPLHCSLSVNNALHSDSALLFPELFKCKGEGLLVRLCYAEERSNSQPQHKTTADWNKYLQSIDENDICNSSPSPLAAYESGPLLVVFQSNRSREMSCDAWFLWKPEAINAAPFLTLPEIQQESTAAVSASPDPVVEELCMRLPLVTISDDQQATIDGEFVLDLSSAGAGEDLANSHTRDLEVSPSELPEMKALLTYEWIQRKLVRRLATPDLMFGQMVAPPPSSAVKTCVNADDVLDCFHETGSPSTSELSPIANDVSDVVKVHDPRVSGDGVPSFENVANTTPGSRKQYHGVNYCLQTEDSVMDARLTRIQQRYLLSERAGNCSSSNTPEVKLEQRRRRRMRKTDTHSHDNDDGGDKKERTTKEEGAVGGSGRGVEGTGAAVERLELTVREEGREKGREEVVSSREAGGGSPDDGQAKGERNEQKPPSVPSQPPVDPAATTPTRSSGTVGGVKLSKSPVVRLHRIETPPSSRPASLVSRLKHSTAPGTVEREHAQVEPSPEKNRLELTVNDSLTSGTDTVCERESSHGEVSHSGAKLRQSPRKKLELTLSDAAQTSGGVEQGSSSGSGGAKLRRSPRKNKWIAGKRSGRSGSAEEGTLSSHKGKTNKKKLEQIIVVALKKKGMKRDHICFRKCYNRLFNLSKSFLKDLRSSKALVSEMNRVVDFNVAQVIDFELRQAKTSL